MKLKSVMSKASLIAIVALSVPSLPILLTSPASAETGHPNLIAQNNPFNDVDDGVLPLIVNSMRMMESAKKMMNSNDPEVKRMAQEMYNRSVQDLNSLMTMWMKKNPPIRTTSPR